MASLNGTLDGALLLGGCLDFNLTADGGGSNSTVMPEEQQQEYMENPLSYKVVATVMHVLIFLGGVFGNVVLILVARKTSSLQTPTYCYLERR
ncbi:hypothetical protein BV898_19458 [Hypsibius exemplaris]|uniref:Uncharacterized protein n=1 Tax=Hypsibius exemplaris TaxID=2072580 RepID=A0A9X6NLR1_HYPEX|nr:hypothetical protein BV898_19458 [Hypsibius exemplaris]